MGLRDYFVVEINVCETLVDLFDSTDDGDEYGNCMGWWFATAHVLYHLNEVPDEWNYNHGLCLNYDPNDSDDFDEAELQYRISDDLVSISDLIEFGNTLLNVCDILKEQGKDY